MEGPAKADIDLKDKKDGTCDVQYTCTEPGTLFNATNYLCQRGISVRRFDI